jgi:hypothetical protein
MIEFSFGTIGILLLAAGLPSETSRPGVWRVPADARFPVAQYRRWPPNIKLPGVLDWARGND